MGFYSLDPSPVRTRRNTWLVPELINFKSCPLHFLLWTTSLSPLFRSQGLCWSCSWFLLFWSGACLTPLVLTPWALPTSDYWGRKGVARCAEEMTGICRDSNRLLTPCHTRLRRPPRGPFSYQGVSTSGIRHSPVDVFCIGRGSCLSLLCSVVAMILLRYYRSFDSDPCFLLAFVIVSFWCCCSINCWGLHCSCSYSRFANVFFSCSEAGRRKEYSEVCEGSGFV